MVRRLLFRVVVLVLGVLVVPLAHGVALSNPEPDPPPPPELGYPADNPILDSEPAGNLAMTTSVTPGGQYTARIAIDVPPGRAGVQPSLALTYASSSSANGHLGVGWSLEGLSEIRRCRKTRATEGYPAGIAWTNADSFCLDGQKLLRVDGGDVESLNGAEFRTERDPWARVTAHGDSSQGPASFTVKARNGQILEYATVVKPRRFQGGFDDVVPTDLGKRPAMWLISSARDRAGNVMRFEHEILEDPGTFGVEARIKAITYTETWDGKPGKRSVEFHYKDKRADPLFAYEAGARWETNSLLDRIVLKGPDPVAIEELGEYRLEYAPSPDTGRSLLASVTRCDSQDVCLRSKKFRWWERTAPGQPPLDFESVAITPFDEAAKNVPDAVVVADFTGDGLDDVLYRVSYYDPADHQPIYLRVAALDAAGQCVLRARDPGQSARARLLGGGPDAKPPRRYRRGRQDGPFRGD